MERKYSRTIIPSFGTVNVRNSFVGAAKGPDLFDIIDFIGVEETKTRVEKAMKAIGV